MDQARAVDGVFAVVTRVVVSTGNVHRPLFDERKQLRCRAGQGRRFLSRIVPINYLRIIGNGRPGEGGRCRRRRNARRRGMANIVGKTGVRQGSIGAATLMIKPQRVRPCEGHPNAVINEERQ